MPRRTSVRQLAGPAEISAALEQGEPVRLILYRGRSTDSEVAALIQRARARGIRVRSERPEPTLEKIFQAQGAVWLLVGVTYPGNAGFAIRTAEVSGADGIIVAAAFDHEGRRQAVRASMRADWYMPVVWAGWEESLEQARSEGFTVIGIEDVGRRAPWEVDLTGPVLLVVGAEERGIPPEMLEQCDETVRLPMKGFIRSYNLQVAVAVMAVERLRQLQGSAPAP
jgi:tRNA G18 (ribose-2'-O)-methylase SpoU